MPPDFQALFLLATAQQGYFTASQAKRLGYTQQNQAHHVQAGNWKRIARGIFRLENFPPLRNPELVICHLWALDIHAQPQGVFSYETALQLHELSDWTGYGLGQGIHMTVPKKFRRHSRPPFRMTLHKEHLKTGDFQRYSCFNVTTPLRTILDLLFQDLVEQRFLKQAMQHAWDRGLVAKRHLDREVFSDWQAAKVSWLLDLAGIKDVSISKC